MVQPVLARLARVASNTCIWVSKLKMVMPLCYNTTLSQVLSPCGNYVLAGNNYGNIAVYDFQKVFNQGEGLNQCNRRPIYTFNSQNDLQICSMTKSEKFLIIGTVGEISGYDWSTVTATKHPKISFSLQIPTRKDVLEQPDVNSLIYDATAHKIYAGCGDNNIYVFCLEDGKLLRTLTGHSDYIHSIHRCGNQLVSGSEDGTVRLWDMLQQSCTNKLFPHEEEKLSRNKLGKWIGAVSLNEDWLVCGGGPRFSLWNLRSLQLAMFADLDDTGIHVAAFYDDHLMAGGASPCFHHLGYNGEVIAQIPTSSPTVLSVVHQDEPFRVLCLAGSSNKIDLCTNFNYRDLILQYTK